MENRMHASKLLIVAVTILITLVAVELWGEQSDTPTLIQPAQFRYQVSAWGTQLSSGAYIIDTATGEVWHSSNGGPPKRIGSVAPQGAQ
jgi:hypothetical protein